MTQAPPSIEDAVPAEIAASGRRALAPHAGYEVRFEAMSMSPRRVGRPHRSASLGTAALLAAALGGAPACGSNGGDAAPSSGSAGSGLGGGGAAGGGAQVVVVDGAVALPSESIEKVSSKFDGYARSAGTRGGLTLVGTTLGVAATGTDQLAPLPLIEVEPNLPADTGEVRAIAPVGDGLLVASERGLYFAKDDALFVSAAEDALHPLGLLGLASRISDEEGKVDVHLTLRTEQGLYELEQGELRHWLVAEEKETPSAALGTAKLLFAAFGARLYEVDKATKSARPIEGEFGNISAIACSPLACPPGSVMLFATDKGLLERGASGEYVHYPLAEDGDPPLPVLAIALDESRQRSYALVADASVRLLVRIAPGSVPAALATLEPSDAASSMAVDKAGDVWVFEGGSATRFATGTPLSFAADVAPVFDEYCNSCHEDGANGAPTIDFTDYGQALLHADKALERMKEGTMPPPGSPAVPKEQLQLITDWSVTKAP